MVATALSVGVGGAVWACTSAIVGSGASASGRMLLWKHRDTGTEHSFVARVEPRGDALGYVALYNGGDSLLREAWAGVNSAGFGIINTASYNLAPDTARVRDREGLVMAEALRSCRRVADFDSLLSRLERPMGVQANFGVADREGRAAWFETHDHGFTRYDLPSRDSVVVRTNYSHSGEVGDGFGYIREATARQLLAPMAERREVSPTSIMDSVSCSFYHSLLGYDPVDSDTTATWLVDQDFIPRYSSGACVVIELPTPDEAPSSGVMWTALGYAPAAVMRRASLDSIDPGLLPQGLLWRSPLCDEAVARKRKVFPIERGSGKHYIYLPALRDLLTQKQLIQK